MFVALSECEINDRALSEGMLRISVSVPKSEPAGVDSSDFDSTRFSMS